VRKLIGRSEDFQDLLRSLSIVARSYDKTSKILTLGLEKRFRREAILRVEPGRILDVGSGTGVMAKEALDNHIADYVVALEPLPEFLAILRSGLENPLVDVVQGYVEYIPFRDGAFNTVMAGFMLRDVRDMVRSVMMMARVSKQALVILDFWRPDTLGALLVEVIYMFLIMGIVAAIAPRDLPGYMGMIKTVFKVPKLGVLVKILKKLGRTRIRCWALCILFLVRVDISSIHGARTH
jgi:ubiquinone/menaquinone biosynthesis C-methylase UbiE